MKKLMLLLVMLMSFVFVSCSDDGDGGNDDPKTCTPACDAWETCNTTTGTCVLTAGKCETNANCTDAAKPICNTTNNTCEKEEATCNTVCESWETCNNGNCELTPGKCNSNAECTGVGIVCNLTTHSCETETIECTPACESWELCAQGTCILAAGKCNVTADCTGTDTCNTATHICENSNPGDCVGLSIEADTMEYIYDAESDYGYYAVVLNETTDLYLDYYEVAPVGQYDLASEGVNDNFATCEQCFTAVDYDAEGNLSKEYFQSQGTLVVTAGEVSSGDFAGTIANFKLVESTIDWEGDGTSTPVANGKCYEIETGILSLITK